MTTFSPILAAVSARRSSIVLPSYLSEFTWGWLSRYDLDQPLLQLALGDLRAHVLGLVRGLLLEDPELALAVFCRDLVLGHVERAGRSHVQGDVPREVAEVVVAGHEVGLAVDLHQHADLAPGMDVALDDALGRGALAALGGLCLTLDAQDLYRLLDVAFGLGQGRLAVHHPRAGLVAEGLDVACLDVCHQPPSSLVSAGGVAGASAAGCFSSAGWGAARFLRRAGFFGASGAAGWGADCAPAGPGQAARPEPGLLPPACLSCCRAAAGRWPVPEPCWGGACACCAA